MDRFIETHKFQLGPHIAENVVPSLTVTDIDASIADPITPARKICAGGYQPDAPARVGRLFPRWRVGLVFVTFFHAGVISHQYSRITRRDYRIIQLPVVLYNLESTGTSYHPQPQGQPYGNSK